MKLKAKHEPGENLVKFPETCELSKVGDKQLKFPKPGENLVKFSKPCEDLVKFRNLVKTWSNFQKPGECLGEVRAIFSTSGIF